MVSGLLPRPCFNLTAQLLVGANLLLQTLLRVMKHSLVLMKIVGFVFIFCSYGLRARVLLPHWGCRGGAGQSPG